MTNANPCYGLYSAFAIDSEKCKQCPQMKNCAVEAYTELALLTGVDRKLVAKLVKKHRGILSKIGVTDIPDLNVAEATVDPNKVLKDYVAMLSAKGIMRENFIATDLTEAPETFRAVVEILRLRGSTTQSSILAHVKATTADTQDQIANTALALQALQYCNLVKQNKSSIKWMGD